MRTRSIERIRIRDRSGRIKGPFLRDEVLKLIRDKKIDGEEEIFLEGEGRWKPIASETEFFDLIQEVVFGIKSGTQNKSISDSKGAWESSFEKDPYPKVDQTEKLPTLHKTTQQTVPTQVLGTKTALAALEPVVNKKPTIDPTPEPRAEPKVEVPVAAAPTVLETPLRGFEDIEGGAAPEKKTRRFMGAPILFVLLLAGLAIYFLPQNRSSIDVTKITLAFNLKKGYFRPLLLRLRLLNNIELPPKDLKNDLDQIKLLPINVQDLILKVDELDRDQTQRTNASTWVYKAWTYRVLADVISAGDPAKGKEFKEVSVEIVKQLEDQGRMNAELKVLFSALDRLLEGEIGKSIQELAALKEATLVSEIFKREVTYWASLGGAEAATVKISYNDLSEVTMKYQYEEELRQKVSKDDFDKDFQKTVENVLNQDSHSLLAWFLLSKYYSTRFQGNPAVPSRYFFTGLCQLSLWPRTLQSMYWRVYAQFLEQTGSKEGARLTTTADLISKNSFESSSAAVDIDDPLFRFSSLLQTYRKAFEQNEMNPIELSSFEVLSEASTDAKENLISVVMAPLLEKNWSIAERRLRILEKTFPFDPEVKTLRVWLEGERFRFERAEDLISTSFGITGSTSAEVLRAEGVLYTLGRDYDHGNESLRKYLEKNPQDPITFYFLARGAFESEKYTECVRYSQLAQLNSIGPLKLRSQTMNYRCRVLASLGVEDALREFSQFISQFPHTSISREEYVRALVDADRSNEAVKIAEQDVVDNPDNPNLKILLGEIYEKRGANNEALALYNEARRIDPKNAKAAVHIGDLFFNDKRYKEAAENYVAAGAQDLEFPELFLKAARAYQKAGNFDKAEEMYFQEVNLRPAVLDTFLEAAEFFLESNRPSQVPELFKLFSENFKSDPRVLTRLSQAYYAIGDPKNARINAELAVRLNPTEAEPYRILGNLFEAEGQYSLAKANYEKYLLLVPQAPEAAELKRKLALPPFSSL